MERKEEDVGMGGVIPVQSGVPTVDLVVYDRQPTVVALCRRSKWLFEYSMSEVCKWWD